MINLIQARELTIQYLEPFLKEHEYDIKTNKAKEAKIERKRKNGVDSIGLNLLNYNPSYQVRYGFNKVNSAINEIMLKLQEKVPIPVKEDKKSRFLFFSYNTLNDPKNTDYLPYMANEAEVQKCVNMMIEFMKETAFPLLDRFEDLREYDKIINGDEPWESDWLKPYPSGGNFHLKRLIISKLSGVSNYDKILDFIRTDFTSHFDGPNADDYKSSLGHVEELNKVLQEVKPLY